MYKNNCLAYSLEHIFSVFFLWLVPYAGAREKWFTAKAEFAFILLQVLLLRPVLKRTHAPQRGFLESQMRITRPLVRRVSSAAPPTRQGTGFCRRQAFFYVRKTAYRASPLAWFAVYRTPKRILPEKKVFWTEKRGFFIAK